jgi:hypothetical protein
MQLNYGLRIAFIVKQIDVQINFARRPDIDKRTLEIKTFNTRVLHPFKWVYNSIKGRRWASPKQGSKKNEHEPKRHFEAPHIRLAQACGLDHRQSAERNQWNQDATPGTEHFDSLQR